MPQPSQTNSPAIRLYAPASVGVGVLGSLVGAAFGATLAWVAQAEGDTLGGGLAAAMLLAASWLLPWVLVALTGPYQAATAGMAWLALSTARLLVLVLAGVALGLAAPTMGLGLWLALLCGGLAAVVIDTAMALRAFGGLGGNPQRLGRARLATGTDSMDALSGGTT